MQVQKSLSHQLSGGMRKKLAETIRATVGVGKNSKNVTGNKVVVDFQTCSIASLHSMHREESGKIFNLFALIFFEQPSQMPYVPWSIL